MIDTHAHLSKRLCDVPDEVIKRLKNEKIKVILAASNIIDSKENIELAKDNSGLFWPAIGIHPQDTDPKLNISIDDQINLLDNMVRINSDVIVAIGECGLDYSPAPPGENERSKKEQEILFRGQIALALKHKLPLIIHARKAVDETVEILKDYKNLKGVFHCYAGGKKRIEKIINLGKEWYFGIDGNLTYEDGLSEVVKSIPYDRLLLETDSPFLTPEPMRGQVNNPTNVKFIYQKVSEIWGKSLNETEKIIDGNAIELFQLP
jgi:TatD DNase family protein